MGLIYHFYKFMQYIFSKMCTFAELIFAATSILRVFAEFSLAIFSKNVEINSAKIRSWKIYARKN